MLNFVTSNPTRQTIRNYFYPGRDEVVQGILQSAQTVLDHGWQEYPTIHGPDGRDAFLHRNDELESLVGDWVADHLYGNGTIDIDPGWMKAQLHGFKAKALTPTLDTLTVMYLWAWWRECYLMALIRNQKRGIPLGASPESQGDPAELTDYGPMPLHILPTGSVVALPSGLCGRLEQLADEVLACIEEPTWVLIDASQLKRKVVSHYCELVQFLLQSGVKIQFSMGSFADAIDELSKPPCRLPGYVGPQYKFGVGFRAGCFLVAQALALEAQEPEDSFPDDEETP